MLLRPRHLSPFNATASPACDIRVVRCSDCRMLRLDPRPDDPTLARLQERHDGAAEAASLEVGNRHPELVPLLVSRLQAAGFPSVGGHLLDVGCGSGDLLVAVAGRLGAAATGLDVSERALDRARRRFAGHTWIRGAVEAIELPRSSFDAITLVHVLEHLPSPLAVLESLRSSLRPGGILAVEVPNGELFFSPFYSLVLESPKPAIAAILRSMGRRVPFTARGFYPYHLSLFGVDSLRAMVTRAGYEVLRVEMPADHLRWRRRENCRPGSWPRFLVNTLKIGLARRGLGDTLLLVARNGRTPSPQVGAGGQALDVAGSAAMARAGGGGG